MKTQLLFVGALLLFARFTYAQLYFCNTEDQVGILNPQTCEYDILATFDDLFTDIALTPNGKLYGTTGSRNDLILVEIDLQNATLDTIYNIPGVDVTSLVCSADNVLYFGYRRIGRYFLDGATAYITPGVLPQYLAGDLVFYGDELYGSLYNLSRPFEGNLYQIDSINLYSGEIVMNLSDDKIFGGLTIDYDELGKDKKLIGSVGSPDRLVGSSLFEIDLEADTILPICEGITFPPVTRNSHIFGLTSSDEFRTNFSVQLDLDVDNSSGRLIDHFEVDSLCIINFPVSDTDVRIQSDDDYIDSLVVELISGVRHPGQETLTGASNMQIGITGDRTDRLVLHNNGTATIADFEEMLTYVRFIITADDAERGERIVHTTVYANDQVSDPAKSFLQINIDETPSAGLDSYVESCARTSRIDLFEELGGNPRRGGRWEPALSHGNEFSTYQDTSGIYRYIVQEGGCAADTAEVEVFLFPPPDVDLGGDSLRFMYACTGDTVLLDATHPDGVFYVWQDGQTGPLRMVTEDGGYNVQIRNEKGCFGFGLVYVLFSDTATVQTQETITRCTDEPFMWQGQSFSTDTVLCQTYNRISGCDSTHCITLEFLESPQTQADYVFCGGSEQAIEGVKVSRDTSFCATYPAANGCDSTRCVTIEFAPPLQGQEQASICMSESYPFGDQLLTQSGTYLDTVQLAGGCDSIIQLQLTVNPSYENTLDTSILEGQVLEIGNQIFANSGNYVLQFQTVADCDSLLFLHLNVLPDTTTSTINANPAALYAPTILSQSNSNYADVFMLYAKNGQPGTIRKLSIMDALGRVVFYQQNIPLGATHQGWRAEQVATGIYFYQTEVLHNENRTLESGKIVVVQ